MADVNEETIYEAFGLGEKEQEPAALATETSEGSTTGEKEQEPAAPAQVETQPDVNTQAAPTTGTADPEEPGDSGSGDDVTGEPMSPDQRRENAARRRQQEQQEAINQAVFNAKKQAKETHDAEMAGFFARAGLKNTFTGEPITSIQQFDEWNEKFQAAKLEKDLKAGKLTQEGLNAAIGSHPAVRQAQLLAEQDAAEKQSREQEAAKARIQAELEEIHKVDASISTLEDLFKAPYGKDFYDMTQRGYSIKDAHYLLTKDTLEAAKLEAARQAGMNSARSKDHLNATANTRGGGSITVPNAEMEMYRLFNPTASAAEIQEHYNKTMKK